MAKSPAKQTESTTGLQEVTPAVAGGINRMETWAKGLMITNGEEFTTALLTLKGIKTVRSQITESFKESKGKTHEAWKAVVAHEKSFTDRCDSAEKTAKAVILKYQLEQERIAEEERRVKQAAEDFEAQRERDRLARLAKNAHARGDTQKASLFEERKEAHIAPVIEAKQAVPDVAGVNKRKTWKFEIKDRMAFLNECCKKNRTDLLEPNETTLDALAKGLREQAVFPGVRFYEDSTLAVGRG